MSIIKKEIKIGLITIIALIILGWGFNFLKGHNILKGGVSYYGVYSNVSGMNETCPIFFRGLKIGSVRSINLHPTQHDKLLVNFVIVKDISFPINSVARIYSLDLMGTKGVEIVEGDSKELLEPNDTIKTYVVGDFKDQLNIEVLPLKEKMEKLIVNFDSLILNINHLFTGKNKANIAESLKSLNIAMSNTAKMSDNLANSFSEGGEYNSIMKHTDSIVIALKRQMPFLDTTFHNMATFSTQLNKVDIEKTLLELNRSLKQATGLFEGLNEGDGSMGMLLNDKELYYNMVDASANLNRLLQDVRHQPKKYVRFSAIGSGKSYYTDGQIGGMKGIVFQVKLFEANNPVRLDSAEVAGKYRIFEDFDGKRFFYTVGQSRNYDSMKLVFDEVKVGYPQSEIIALENGRLISVNKALRKLKN